MRYAVVQSAGRHGSGETVYAAGVCAELGRARSLAAQYTRAHKRSMARYGGTSGGYRVIEVHDSIRSRRDVSWMGMDLDGIPSV